MKKSLVVTDVEMIESVRGLVKRDLLYHENEQIFYNIWDNIQMLTFYQIKL